MLPFNSRCSFNFSSKYFTPVISCTKRHTISLLLVFQGDLTNDNAQDILNDLLVSQLALHLCSIMSNKHKKTLHYANNIGAHYFTSKHFKTMTMSFKPCKFQVSLKSLLKITKAAMKLLTLSIKVASKSLLITYKAVVEKRILTLHRHRVQF